jgi:hypothetical protein
MNKQIADKAGTLDIADIEKTMAADTDSVPSLIMKLKQSKLFPKLPDWIEKYPIPADTIASGLPPVKCLTRLVQLQKKSGFNIHPVHQLDLITGTCDVVVTPKGATATDGKEVTNYGVSMGYLLSDLNDAKRIIHASTADIVVMDAKVDKNKNITAPEWPENYGVPMSQAAKIRSLTQCDTPSRSKARDEIFVFLSSPKNSMPGIRLHSIMGSTLENFSEVPALTQKLKLYYAQRKIAIKGDAGVKVVGVDNGPVVSTSDTTTAYKFYFRSIGIRGGRDGKGVSHGFERFSMSRVMANSLNLVLDFKNMMRVYNNKDNTVVVRDSSYLSAEELRVLQANKFRIIVLNTLYPQCKPTSPPGLYGQLSVGIDYVEYFNLSSSGTKPEMQNKTITMGKYYEEALLKLSKSKKAFALLHIDARMDAYRNVLSYLPSATADTMQVIVAAGADTTYPLPDLVKRTTMAISCRNRFPYCRKAFCTMDIMNKFVRWEQEIFYPRLRDQTDKKFIDLEQVVVSEDLRFIPLKVREKDFENIIAQIEPVRVTTAHRIHALLDQLGDYYVRVYAATMFDSKDPFCLVDDGGTRWLPANNDLLALKEKEFMVALANDEFAEYRQLYNRYLSEMAAQVNEDEDRRRDDDDNEGDGEPGQEEEADDNLEGAQEFEMGDDDLELLSVDLTDRPAN